MAQLPITQQEQQNISKSAQNEQAAAGAGQVIAVKGRSGQTVTYNVDEAKKGVNLQVGGNAPKTNSAGATPNPLDAFASYTYAITLHVLTSDAYNSLNKNPYSFKPTKTLISTAGRYSQSSKDASGNVTGRDPAFNLDFYFDHLKFQTVIGLNGQSRGTNAITFDFTIIEPYGMTLLDRIMDVNIKDLQGKNYLDMPYLLEVNFFGYDDNGKSQKVSELTKWFPIKLTSFKIKASIKGSEYAITAVPFNHSANFETIQSLKTRMHVDATTINDYFCASLNDASMNSVNSGIDTETQRAKKPTPPAQDTTNQGDDSGANAVDSQVQGNTKNSDPSVRTPSIATDDTQQNQPPIVVNANSFTAAYNAWWKAEVDNSNIKVADEIQFVFTDPELMNSTIVDSKKTSVRRVGSTDAKSTANANAGKDSTTTDFNSVVHDLEVGTSVNDVINLVIPQSKYYLDQVTDNSSTVKAPADQKTKDDSVTGAQSNPVKMWKIIPSIELLGFDTERNCWGKRITFTVSTFLAYQKKDDRLPQSLPPKEVKRYDYFYTGKNSSVIEFDIDYNALYYTAVNVDRGKSTAGTGAAQKPEDQQLKDKRDNIADNRQIQPNQKSIVSDSHSASAGGANTRSETINARSTLDSVYTSAGGDMINLKMKIIGDPEFIKQDDLFVTPAAAKTKAGGNAQTQNSVYVPGTTSIDMDTGEIYCYVTFRTPSDFNDANGMFDLNSGNKYQVSEFSGYYKVITVENEFSGGKFTQTLNLVRYQNQDPINKSAASSTTVVTNGEAQRQNANAAVTASATKAGNPAVSSKDVDKSDSTNTPTQPDQSQKNAQGPDGDGSGSAQSYASYYTTGSGAAAVAQSQAQQSANAWKQYSNASSAPNPALASIASSAPTVEQTNASVLAALGNTQA
jgi:hypothetical protein